MCDIVSKSWRDSTCMLPLYPRPLKSDINIGGISIKWCRAGEIRSPAHHQPHRCSDGPNASIIHSTGGTLLERVLHLISPANMKSDSASRLVRAFLLPPVADTTPRFNHRCKHRVATWDTHPEKWSYRFLLHSFHPFPTPTRPESILSISAKF